MSRLLVIHVQIIGSSRFSYIIGTGLVMKQKMKFNKEMLCYKPQIIRLFYYKIRVYNYQCVTCRFTNIIS